MPVRNARHTGQSVKHRINNKIERGSVGTAPPFEWGIICMIHRIPMALSMG